MRYAATLLLLWGSGLGFQSANKPSAGKFRDGLDPLVQKALSFVPAVKPDDVVVLADGSELLPYLMAWGYDRSAEV
jgi:hypothetical protein